jgi:hypothetical protein
MNRPISKRAFSEGFLMKNFRYFLRAVLAGLLLSIVAPLAARADVAPERDEVAQKDKPKTDDGWEQVNGGMMVMPGEGFEARTLVSVGYGFIWVMVAGFVLVTWRRTGAVEKELESLRKRITEGEARKAAAK